MSDPEQIDGAAMVDGAAAAAESGPLRLVKLPGGVPDLDADLTLKRAQLPAGEPVRIRIPMQMYNPAKKNYPGLKYNTWVLEFDEVRDVSRLRDDLDEFIIRWVEDRLAGRQ